MNDRIKFEAVLCGAIGALKEASAIRFGELVGLAPGRVMWFLALNPEATGWPDDPGVQPRSAARWPNDLSVHSRRGTRWPDDLGVHL